MHAVCTTSEHGSYPDREAIDLLLEKQEKAILVASRFVLECDVRHPEAYNVKISAKLINVSEAYKTSHKLAVKAVVHIAADTDLGVSPLTTRHNF